MTRSKRKQKQKQTKEKTYSIKQFRKDYPDEDTCLDKLFQVQYGKLGACPKCGVINVEFKRISTRRCYQCGECGYQLHPTAGTVFEKTRTPLTYWFYAIYLYTVTRNGVAAKELQRQLDVTYKTAWRMADQIRKIMVSTEKEKLKGLVIMDETFIGGLNKNRHKNKKKDGTAGKTMTMVFGMLDENGHIVSKVFEQGPSAALLKPIIREHIHPDTIVVTDGGNAYQGLHKEFKEHQIIEHRKDEYVNEEGYTTNPLENHWSSLKRMIKGTHIHVGVKHLPKYIAESIFRYENRNQPEKMFEFILKKLV